MLYKEIVSKVADSTGLSKKLVDKTYKAYWKAIREYITTVPLMDDLTEEDLLAKKPNVNIPSLGKFYVAPDKYRRMKYFLAKQREQKEEEYVTYNSN